MLRSLVALVVIVVATPALAQSYPPFDATKRVRTQPEGYVPPIFGEAGIARLEAALRELPHPFYVLLAEKLPEGFGDEDTRASALVDGLAAEWTRQGMDPSESTLFVMTFDPRKFSLLAGARWKTQLGLEGARLDPFIQRFLDRVRGTPPDPVGGITEMGKRLEEHIFEETDPGRIAARQAWHDASARRQMWTIIIVVAVLLALFAVIFWLIRRGQLGRRRRAFIELEGAWDKRITNAAGRYVEFYGKRDGILGLLELEGKTAALLNTVTSEVDAIYSSVAAMQAHIDEVGERARKARWFRLKPIDEALAQLEAPFEFDTGVLNEADLFGPPTKHLRIEPAKLEEQLEDRFAASLVGWKRLETAADLRFHEASNLVPHTLLDAALARAEEHRLPARWLADHPLFGDDAADLNTWQTADAWRWKDAIAFLDAIEALRAKHDAVSARLERLVAVREQVQAVRIAELEPVAAPGTTLYDAADDPADTIELARSAVAELEQAILAATDVEVVERLSRETVELYRQTAAQRARIVEALARAAPEIEAVHRLRVLSLERLLEATRQSEKAARMHSNSRAAGFVGAAQRRSEAGDAEIAQAEAKLKARRHLDSYRAAEGAKATFLAVREEAERGIAHVDQLEAVRATYESRVAALSQVRAQKQSEIRRYDGGTILDEHHPRAITGPVDYGDLIRALDALIETWNGHVRRAKVAWEEAERRRREAEEAARAARMRAEAARRSSSMSWSSSSSSRSFSSSSSSSSRSSSSGSWGGGRSSSRSGSW